MIPFVPLQVQRLECSHKVGRKRKLVNGEELMNIESRTLQLSLKLLINNLSKKRPKSGPFYRPLGASVQVAIYVHCALRTYLLNLQSCPL